MNEGSLDKQNNQFSKNEDADWARIFQSGGTDAASVFEKLVIKYKNRVFNLCYRFLGDYTEADDCAQEVFLKVYRNLNGFRFDSAFSTWVYRIAVNTCKNKLVSGEYKRKNKTVSIDVPLNNSEGDCTMEIRDESFSPEKELDKKEKAELIQQAIESLPDDQKQVVILREIEQLSYEEIAKVSGLNLGTVKSKLARARIALCDKLRRLL